MADAVDEHTVEGMDEGMDWDTVEGMVEQSTGRQGFRTPAAGAGRKVEAASEVAHTERSGPVVGSAGQEQQVLVS